MNKKQYQAIVLRYEGKTYEEISQALNGYYTSGTLKQYFSSDGLLYSDYLDYELTQNKLRLEESKRILQRTTVVAVEAIVGVLKGAVASGDGRLALKAAEIVLDKTGLAIVDKDEHEDKQVLSDEELFAVIAERGINPDTGLPLEVDELQRLNAFRG